MCCTNLVAMARAKRGASADSRPAPTFRPSLVAGMLAHIDYHQLTAAELAAVESGIHQRRDAIDDEHHPPR